MSRGESIVQDPLGVILHLARQRPFSSVERHHELGHDAAVIIIPGSSSSPFRPWPACAATRSRKKRQASFSIDHDQILLAPYVWKRSGEGPSARAEAAMPGAYLKAAFRGSTSVGLVVDGSINRGCPAASMPVIEFSVDDGPFTVVPLASDEASYVVPMASGLDATATHRIEVFFRASDLTQKRRESPIAHLAWRELHWKTASLLPHPRAAQVAIAFGDSITEGVGVDGLFTSWQKLAVNNARADLVSDRLCRSRLRVRPARFRRPGYDAAP